MSRRERRGRTPGFTLIEVIAVVALVGLVLLVAIDFYLDLSHSTREAADRTLGTRRAVALMDRISHDLAGAYLLKKPEETDPLEWPYVFLAEGQSEGLGAERLKFVRQGHRPRSSDLAESDLEMVAWLLGETEEGLPALYRWSSPHLPEGLDRSFPNPESEGTLLVAEGVQRFGVRLLSEEGEWKSSWDSSTLLESSQLPVSAEVVVAFAEGEPDEFGDVPEVEYRRQVSLPLRPLELETLLAPGGVAGFVAQAGQQGEGEEGEEGEEDDEDSGLLAEDDEDRENCVTVRQCFARHPEARARYRAEFGVDPLVLVSSIGDECFRTFEPIMQQVGLFAEFGVSLADCL